MPKYSCAPPLAVRNPVTTLVEYENDAIALGHFAELVEELGKDRLQTHVGARRLQDDRGDVVVVLERPFERFYVVGGQNYHGAERLSRYAADSLGSSHEVVAPAVEVVLELDDLRLSGVGARHANGHHIGLGAGAMKADLLGAWDQLPDPVAPLHFEFGRAGEVGASGHLLLDRADDLRAGVSKNQRAVSREVVQDAVAVHIVLGRALSVSVVELERVLASRVVGHPVREEGAGRLVHFGGLGMELEEALFD